MYDIQSLSHSYKNFYHTQIYGSYLTYEYLFYYNSFLVLICLTQ